jgi:hypothetical protein
MSFQERRSIMYIISTITIVTGYSLFMLPRYPDAGEYSKEIFRWWGAFFLILIPVSIVAKILFHIIFSIINTVATQEEEPTFLDERDKLVELKAQMNAGYVFIIGVMLGMGTLVFDQPPVVMFSIFFISGILTELLSEILKFRYYRRGF